MGWLILRAAPTLGKPRPLDEPGLDPTVPPMAKQLSIEDLFAQVEAAVGALEGGELPLEEALARYEAGLKAVRAAKAQLDRYAARLEELKAEPEPPAAGG